MATLARLVVLCCVLYTAHAQYEEERSQRYTSSDSRPAVTPVPILKQINRHNEDGSYTYGYEAADGSFKIETKSPAGEVKGKYGYKDDTGKVRVVEYGANKYGFQPSGEGITVAAPTLVDESATDQEPRPKQGGRSQYRAPPSPAAQNVDYDYDEPRQTAPTPAPYRPPQAAPAPYRPPQPAPAPYRAPQPAPRAQYRQPAPVNQVAPRPPKPAFFSGAAPAPAEQEYFRPESQQYKPAPRPGFHTVSQHFNTEQSAPQFRSQPQIEYSQDFDFPSNPRFAPQNPAPVFAPKPAANQNAPTFSMLDQLLKEYALPQGGAAPLHDITFGSY